jgi:hypothetical protein
MAPPFAGQPGHGSTAFLRNQPVRMADGRPRGGYTGVYELICPSCGDHPYLDYSEIPLRLQRLRGPCTLEATLAAHHKHLGIPWADENGSGSLGPGQAKASVLRKYTATPRKPGHLASATAFAMSCGPTGTVLFTSGVAEGAP